MTENKIPKIEPIKLKEIDTNGIEAGFVNYSKLF